MVKNWKTSVAGALLILAGVAEAAGIHANGLSYSGSPLDLIIAGVGLLAAKDGDK